MSLFNLVTNFHYPAVTYSVEVVTNLWLMESFASELLEVVRGLDNQNSICKRLLSTIDDNTDKEAHTIAQGTENDNSERAMMNNSSLVSLVSTSQVIEF